jgi:hypothetical protein
MLESRTARLKLPKRRKPYFVRIDHGLSLGYRRNETAGPWIVRTTDGKGGNRMARTKTHMKEKVDWKEYFLCLILIEPFTTREEALEAETNAIRTEFPKFNVTHNRRRHPIQELVHMRTSLGAS